MKSPDELLIYLRYLRGKIDALESAQRLGVQEVAPLQGEIRAFRERVPAMGFASASLKEHLSAVRLDVAPAHLEGTREHFRSTWWLHLPVLRFFRATRQQKDRAVIDAELSNLKSNLYDLYCLVEVTFKESNQSAHPPLAQGQRG